MTTKHNRNSYRATSNWTGRRWCDFVAYDPRVIRGPTLFIRRFEPTDEARAAFETAAEAFLAYVERLFEAATTA